MILPDQQQIQILRKGLRKKLPPKIHDDISFIDSSLGEIQVLTKDSELYIKWKIFDNNPESDFKVEKWNNLCLDPQLENDLLEIGILGFEIFDKKAKEVRDSIGHPMAALQQSYPIEELAERWKHWGIVPAGFMLGLK